MPPALNQDFIQALVLLKKEGRPPPTEGVGSKAHLRNAKSFKTFVEEAPPLCRRRGQRSAWRSSFLPKAQQLNDGFISEDHAFCRSMSLTTLGKPQTYQGLQSMGPTLNVGRKESENLPCPQQNPIKRIIEWRISSARGGARLGISF